jgi:hypothetical protein
LRIVVDPVPERAAGGRDAGVDICTPMLVTTVALLADEGPDAGTTTRGAGGRGGWTTISIVRRCAPRRKT